MYNSQSSPQANLGTHSLPQTKPLSVGNHHTFSELPFNLPSVSINLSHLNMLSKWNDLCDWVLSLSMMFSGVCCSMYQYFMSFYCQIIFLCMDRSHLIYLVIKGWTFGSFPLFRYLSNNYEHLCASVFFFFFFFFFGHSVAYGVPRPGIRSKPHLWSAPPLWQIRIHNPLFQARDQTLIPRLQSHHRSHCITVRTPVFNFCMDIHFHFVQFLGHPVTLY